MFKVIVSHDFRVISSDPVYLGQRFTIVTVIIRGWLNSCRLFQTVQEQGHQHPLQRLQQVFPQPLLQIGGHNGLLH